MIPPHGGKLVDRTAPEAEQAELLREAAILPQVELNERETADLEMLACGAMSPLEGFMTEADYRAVVDTMHLAKGLAWSIPVALSAAIRHISEHSEKSWTYHLIVLDSSAHTVEVTPYDRDSLERALNDYSTKEEEAASGRRIEPVLVSAGRMDALRRAYPNFFLDISEFMGRVLAIVSDAMPS
jgi:ATP sulfurylase